jgi:SAM-dependent methyltransferase
MNALHNSIKYKIYEKYANGVDSIIELGGGHANDLHRWIKYKIKNVFLVDNNPLAIQEGKIRRANISSELPNVHFILDDINNPTGLYANKLVNVIFCNFAIHFFLKNEHTVKNFKQVIDTYLSSGGYFVFMALDGKKIFNILKENNVMLDDIQIIKKYNDNIFKYFGQEIEVNITTRYNEYLVNFDYLKEVFNEYKIIEDCNFYNRGFKMNKSELFYSNLNRYLVLQRI